MRTLTMLALSLSLACSTVASASSGLSKKLWILNQQGAAYVGDFFDCVLSGTNWNDLANTYAAGETLSLGKQVQRNDAPCTGGVGTTGFYQCAVNAGNFDVSDYDVLLVIIPDPNGYGGQNGTATVTNPVNGKSVLLNVGHVATSPDPKYQTIYGGHEVFEAQTDGVSGDCCDGETASGGPFPWCAQCGDYAGGTGVCGKYAPGGTVGTLGIDTIVCPHGTYQYQRVSPASNEFDGTCAAIAPKASAGNPCGNVGAANNGTYCGKSRQSGFLGGAPDTLYDCQNGWVASTKICAFGCFTAPAGQDDGCNAAPADGGAGEVARGGASDASAEADAGSERDAGAGVDPGMGNPPGGASTSSGCAVGGGSVGFAWLVAGVYAVAVFRQRRRRRVNESID